MLFLIRQSKAFIKAGGSAKIFIQPNVRNLVPVFSHQHFSSPVGGCVVDHQDFIEWANLLHERSKTSLQQSTSVVSDHYCCNAWFPAWILHRLTVPVSPAIGLAAPFLRLPYLPVGKISLKEGNRRNLRGDD